MRYVAVLTLYVCSAVSIFADEKAASDLRRADAKESTTQNSDWMAVHANARLAMDHKDYATAVLLLHQSLPMAHSAFERGITNDDLGLALYRLDRYEAARSALEAACAIWLAQPRHGARLGRTVETLALIDRLLGEYRASEKVLRETLALPVFARSAGNPDTRSALLGALADLCRELAHLTESRRLFTEAAELRGASWQHRVAAMIGLAELDREARIWDQAASAWQQVIRAGREHQAPEFEAVGYRGLGQTWLEMGDPSRAEPALRKALALSEAGSFSDGKAPVLICLGRLLLGENKLAMAEESLLEALRMEEKAYGPDHPQVGVILQFLGQTRAQRGHLEEARADFVRARSIMAGRFGERSPMTGSVDANWGLIEQQAHHPSEAAARFETALAALNTAGGDLQKLRDLVLRHYVQSLNAANRKDEARAVMESAFNR